MPALVNASAFMQSHTQLSDAFKIQSGPPMAQPSGTATPMTMTRSPQSQILGLAGWTQIPGGAQYVDASPDGTIWAISNIYLNQQGNFIYHYVNGSWLLVGNGNAVRVAIGPDGTTYALQGAGQVYVYQNGIWNLVGCCALDVSVASDGSLYAIGMTGGASYGNPIYHYANGVLTQLPGAGTRVVGSWDPNNYPSNVNAGGFYVVNPQGQIYYYSPGVGYLLAPGAAVQVSPNNHGGLFALGYDTNANHAIYYYDLSSQNGWTQVTGLANSLSAYGSNLYATNSTGFIGVSNVISASAAAVTVDANAPVLANVANADVYGGNFFAYENPNTPSMIPALQSAFMHMVRYPGGATSDYYHWQTNTYSNCTYTNAGSVPPVTMTIDQFEQTIVKPLGADVNITVNYGSNPTCTGGADPNEAATWVNYANNTMHYGVKYWTIGNEQYGAQEPPPSPRIFGHIIDLHSPAGSATYANLVATQFYPLMKAQDPTIQVGVDLTAPNTNASAVTQTWDATVLQNAKYDFVEVHPAAFPLTTDAALLTLGVANYSTTFTQVKTELATAGKPTTPIYVGEWDPIDGTVNPKQTVTIVGGLWAAMVIGEFLNAGVNFATYYAGFSSACSNASSSVYGWQTWGSYSLFADTTAGEAASSCPGATLEPVGTPFPTAIAMTIDGNTFQLGDQMVAPSLGPSVPNLRAYASKRANGYGILLVNIDQSNTITTTVGIANDSRTFSGTTLTYTKAQYDQGASGAYPGPTQQSIGPVSGTFPVTLPPWSMTGITLKASTTSQSARSRR